MNNHENCDNQSILSDITDCFGNITISSDEIAQKLDEINTKTETELNKLTIEVLKEKCKELNIGSISKLKKPELTVNKALFRPGAKPSENFEVDPLAANENDTVVNVQPILKPVTKPPVKVPTVQVKYYKIKSGDTLTEIAARNNTTVSKLCQLNGIKPSTPIQVGRSLRVK